MIDQPQELGSLIDETVKKLIKAVHNQELLTEMEVLSTIPVSDNQAAPKLATPTPGSNYPDDCIRVLELSIDFPQKRKELLYVFLTIARVSWVECPIW